MSGVTFALLAALLVPQSWASFHPWPGAQTRCRYLSSDAQWPSALQWAKLNASVGGRLIAGKPLAQPCHRPEHNETSCAYVRSQFGNPPLYCSPYTSVGEPCHLGNIASYAINVSSAADALVGIRFALRNNIRLTVKNTGHDYIGRSTGQGALALWTHNLKSIAFHSYKSSYYNGSAVRLGAGVQAFEVYRPAADHHLRVTTGFCPTVGIAGGWVTGAGHGPLEGLYGLGADNTLEFEVVTTSGQHLIVTPDNQYSDLFWALSGGGGSTYAIIISQTTRAHPDGLVAGASFNFTNSHDDHFWKAIALWHEHLLELDDLVGFNSFWGFTNSSFSLYTGTWPGVDQTAMAAQLDPFIAHVNALGLPYYYETSDAPNYYGHIQRYVADLPYGIYTTNNTLGGRLIPRKLVANNLPALIAAFRHISRTQDFQFGVNGIASNVTLARVGNPLSYNAVHPAWRESLYTLNMDVYFDLEGPIDVLKVLQKEMNDDQDQLRALTPGGGAYMNEGTFDNPEWKEDYYGPNYDRLLEVKNKYDPSHLLYGPASVGSDHWRSAPDGRLCPAS
nr:fad-linked oxidoreductase zeb1 [Quercus suber]